MGCLPEYEETDWDVERAYLRWTQAVLRLYIDFGICHTRLVNEVKL